MHVFQYPTATSNLAALFLAWCLLITLFVYLIDIWWCRHCLPPIEPYILVCPASKSCHYTLTIYKGAYVLICFISVMKTVCSYCLEPKFMLHLVIL
jgi:hypothetical protein